MNIRHTAGGYNFLYILIDHHSEPIRENYKPANHVFFLKLC